ncbi:hypothetical protein CDAR_463001 [Caerostris darwini]|uniref:Uncharacterized protein n=1 Tax=Caerostris darwini TaxID=1538125 RepID=A0AAV4Q7Q9_9ARAC|nr:hypothetical protein CDAR_463001 [Caerostris darwini]
MAAVMITGRKEDSDSQRRKLIPLLDPLNPTTDNDKALRQSLVHYTSSFPKTASCIRLDHLDTIRLFIKVLHLIFIIRFLREA